MRKSPLLDGYNDESRLNEGCSCPTEKPAVGFCSVSEQTCTNFSHFHSRCISVLSVSRASHTSSPKLKGLQLGKESPGPSRHLQSICVGMQGDLRV